MKRSLWTGLIATGLLITLAFGQSRPTPPKQPAPTPSAPQTQPAGPGERGPMEAQTPIYITGTVILDDGTPVPFGVKVELVYGGRVMRQETTRTDGSFIFDLNDPNSGAFTDASMESGDQTFGGVTSLHSRAIGTRLSRSMGRVDLVGWELRASLPGFVSDTVMLQSRSALDNPDVGPIVLRRMSAVKATTISLNGLKAPNSAKKHLESAQKALQKNKPDQKKAVSELDKAVAEYPDYADAWQLIGEIRMQEKDTAGARKAFEKALSTDSNFISPYLALAGLDVQENRWAEAAEITRQLIALNPFVTRGFFLNAVANYSLGKNDLAEQSIREVQKQDDKKAYPLAHYILAGILAKKGDLKNATTELETYLTEQPDSPYADRVKQSLAAWRQQGVGAPQTGAQPAEPKK